MGGIPGSSKQQPDSAAEMIRRHQWINDWHISTADISFEHAHAHLKHSVYAMESDELKAHLKTTSILFKGVKSEISNITAKVDGIKNHVDSSIGRMITKTQAATIIGTQQDLQKSQQLLQGKMEAMEAKFDLLLSTLLNADAKKGKKALVTKCGPELKSNPDDREGGEGGGSGKNKEAVAATILAVQQGSIAAGSSKEAGGSSGQGQRQHHSLMDSTLILDPDTISKRFTQEIEIGGRTERVFYRDPRLQQADEELARKLNQELNPDYNLEESLEEQRRVEKKKIPKAPRGRGRGRGRGRTQSISVRPIEKGITIREPVEQSRSSLSSQPSESSDRKRKGILMEEPKKSKKNSSSTQIPESVQSTPAEQEEKIFDKVVESTPQINPESSTLQSTANPEESNLDGDSTANPDGPNPDGTTNPDGPNPDGNSSANPDGQEDADPDPEDQGVIDAHDSEEVNLGQADEEKKASRLKIYVYQNEIMSREKIRTAVNEALKRYIYNIKKFKERWRKPISANKHADRRRYLPPRPRRESKFTPDYRKMVKFIPESGQAHVLHDQRQYKYIWAEMADRFLAVQDDFQTFGLGHPDF